MSVFHTIRWWYITIKHSYFVDHILYWREYIRLNKRAKEVQIQMREIDERIKIRLLSDVKALKEENESMKEQIDRQKSDV